MQEYIKNGISVCAVQTTWKDFISNISAWSRQIHQQVSGGTFEIWLNKTVITQGPGRDNIILKRIKNGAVLSHIPFGTPDMNLKIGGHDVTADFIEKKLHTFMRTPGVMFDVILSQTNGGFDTITHVHDIATENIDKTLVA